MNENRPAPSPDAPAAWFDLDDPVMPAAQLAATVEENLLQRRTRLGRFHPFFPTFGHRTAMPEPRSKTDAPNLYYHLRTLNEFATFDASPQLAASPATQVPILGKLWQRLRKPLHELVLFYVNRHAAHSDKITLHLVNALNELTTLAQRQQEEIESLQEQLSLQNSDE